MNQPLIRNWLLVLCGVLEVAISVIYLVMQGTDGPLAFHSWHGTIVFLGKLALAAGACTIAAGIWSSTKAEGWLLVLNGLALSALGLIQYGFTGYRVSFLTVALLVILMAVSTGILGFVAGGWFFTLAGVTAVAFALAFFALGFQWIRIGPGSHADLLWLGAYFGFSAICILGYLKPPKAAKQAFL